jgi:cell shape-determining protein MreD
VFSLFYTKSTTTAAVIIIVVVVIVDVVVVLVVVVAGGDIPGLYIAIWHHRVREGLLLERLCAYTLGNYTGHGYPDVC